MLRLFFSFLLLSLLATQASFAQSRKITYENASLPTLLNFLVTNKLFPLEKHEHYMDYLRVTECDIYKSVHDSQFKQQEIVNVLRSKFSEASANSETLYVKVPSIFALGPYNFNTQSMDILPNNQMKKANILDIFNSSSAICDGVYGNRLTVPTYYTLQLNTPVSLYRIPIKKEIAEDIYPRLDRLRAGISTPIVYGIVYVEIEPVPPRYSYYYGAQRTTLRGQVNRIEIYLDQARTALLKRLDYSEYY